MTDIASLLNQLRLERNESIARPPSRRKAVIVGTAIIGIAAAAFAAVRFADTRAEQPSSGVAAAEEAAAPASPSAAAAPAASSLDASGYVVARRQATVSAKITGKLVAVLIEEGPRVAAGEIIARLDDANARALAVAEAGLTVTQRNLDDTVVRAPFAGIVTVKAAQEGEMVSPVSAGGGFTRTGIGTIVDMDSLEVEVDVSENFISRVQTGQPAAITLNAYPNRRIPGRVVAIIPTADRAKATVEVRVGFAERDGGVLPEMGARVAFLRAETE